MRISAPARRWALILSLILIGAALRFYRLGVSPLRGDEAFTIRYWAASPAEVLSGLAWIEPHPFGALFGFAAWRALVGSSEVAMRLLPALLNLIGVPVLYNLGRRLFHDDRVGLLAGLLWAVNPYQIWHAQDARDYAIWSALSVLAMWLLIRAAQKRHRIDWALYIVSAALALYMFFFEAFFVLIGALAVWRLWRAAWRGWLISMAAVGVLLIPWFGQAWALAHSGYKGTAGGMNLAELWTRFVPALFLGEVSPDLLSHLWPTVLFILAFCLIVFWRRGKGPIAQFLTLYALLPLLLVALAATRMNVFLPRYALAAAPAVLLLAAYGLTSLYHLVRYTNRVLAWIGVAALALTFVVGPLIQYWHSDYRKAADWYGLGAYLRANTRADDLIILTTLDPATGNVDPAFGYYYSDAGGRSAAFSLPRVDVDTPAFLRDSARYRAVWFVPSGDYAGQVDKALRNSMQLISDRGAGQGLLVREYRPLTIKPGEIEDDLHVKSGAASLLGFSIEQTHDQITILLFWEAKPTETVYLHLVGPPNPATGSPLWSQDDHPPLDAPRDVYTLRLGTLPPGRYTLEMGLYPPADPQTRRAWTDGAGQSLGDNLTLTTIEQP